jgi:hypothetical protein
MADTELLIPLAEIAGVFVGFGALIAVRSGGTMQLSEINGIRWVMTSGIWVVIVALAPTIIGSYGLVGHELWLASSLLALALLVVMLVVFARSPENEAELASNLATVPRAEIALVMAPTFWLPLAGLLLALALVMLGLFPDREAALYLTAAGLGLAMSALGLFVAVFWQRIGSGA